MSEPEPKQVAVLKGGGSLERTVSLRSGARAQSALRQLGHEVTAIDVGPDLVEQLLELGPDVAFVALHGSDGEDGTVQGLLEAIGIPYTGSGPGACMRCTDKALAKYLMREAGLPTPAFAAFKESAIKDLGVAAALPGLEQSIGFPMVVKPASQGSALGVKFARCAEELPGAIVGALSYDRKAVIERYVRGRDLAVSVLDSQTPGRAAGGAARRGGDPARRGVLQLRVALRDRHDDVRLPGRAARRSDRARAGAGAGDVPAAGVPWRRAGGPDARRGDAAS